MPRLLLAVLLGFWALAANAQLKVLASIKPLGLIAAAVMDGVSSPQVLLPVGASHHDYALKPSDAARLNGADVVFWVGPMLETFLEKSLSQSTKSVVLMGSQGLRLRPYEEHHHDGHETNKLSTDPHIWLSPANAAVIAQVIADKLTQLEPANGQRYQKNYTVFADALKIADQQIATRLAPVKRKGYIVLHDGYGYFENHYELNHQGALTLSPERQPGAKHLAEIEQQINSGGVVCLFGEPQFQPRYLDSLLTTLHLNRGTVDYLASDVPFNQQGYINFLNTLSEQFYRCLSK